MSVWEERAGRNEALFREVNENIAALEERLNGSSESMPVICECARSGCTAQIEIGAAEYAAVRKHPDRFIVVPGHEEPSVERLLEDHGGYVVVEKQGAAAVAADTAF